MAAGPRAARGVPAKAPASRRTPEPPGRGGGPRPRRRRRPLRRPAARRDQPALGPAPRARRGRALLGAAARDPAAPGPQRQPARRPHRGPPARVPRLRGRDPGGRVRRRADVDLGPRHLRGGEAARRRGDRDLRRRAAARPLRPLPDPRQELDDPPHGPAARPRAGADARGPAADAADPGRAAGRRRRTGASRSPGAACGPCSGASPGTSAARAAAVSRPRRSSGSPSCGGSPARSAATEAVLDGEVVVLGDDGAPTGSGCASASGPARTRSRAALPRDGPATLMLFDVLFLDGRPTLDLPYEERRERLEALELEGAAWQTPSWHRGEGEPLLAAAARARAAGPDREAPRQPVSCRASARADWVKVEA